MIHITKEGMEQRKIPLPPLEVQQEIVSHLDSYQKIIDGAKQVVDNYKPEIKIDPSWPVKTLGEIITLQRGYDLPKTQFINGTVPVVGSNGIIGYHNEDKEKGPGVVTGRSGTIGKVHYIDYEYYWPHNTALFVKEFNGNDRKYIKFLLESIDLKSLGDNVAAVPSLDRKNAHQISVSIPSLDIQKQIVARIEGEQRMVDATKKLIELYQGKIKEKIDEVWGE
jgi:restriction endonuclease S subunit